MRGPGFLMGGWALESALDELASELEMDPIELRLANHARGTPTTASILQQAPQGVLRAG